MDKTDKTWTHYFTLKKDGNLVDASILVNIDDGLNPFFDIMIGRNLLKPKVSISGMLLNNGILENYARIVAVAHGYV